MKSIIKKALSLLLVFTMLIVFIPVVNADSRRNDLDLGIGTGLPKLDVGDDFGEFGGGIDYDSVIVNQANKALAEHFGEVQLSDTHNVVAKFDPTCNKLLIQGYGDISSQKWFEMVYKIEEFQHKWSSLNNVIAASEDGLLWYDNEYEFDIVFKTEGNDTIVFPQSCQGMFSSFDHGNIDFGDCVDTSKVTDMSYMFYNSITFNNPVNFDTSKVRDMHEMFSICDDPDLAQFNQPVNFDTSRVENMSCMFQYNYAFNQPVNFDMRNVKDASFMFNGASSFSQNIDFNLDKVTTIESMFEDSGMDDSVDHVILKTKNSNVEAKDIFKNIGAIYYIAFNGLRNVSLFTQKDGYYEYDSDWIIENVEDGTSVEYPPDQDEVTFENNTPYIVYFVDYRYTNSDDNVDSALVVPFGSTYSADDIANKKCVVFDKERRGSWRLSDTSLTECGKYEIDLIFEPDDWYVTDQYNTIELTIKNMTPTIESDNEIVVAGGTQYSEDNVLTKKAMLDGKAVEGTWHLAPKNIREAGVHEVVLTFKPNDKAIQSVSKKIKLTITPRLEKTIIKSDNRLEISAGESYSVDSIKNKRALSGGAEVAGKWSLSDTSIKEVGTHTIELVFTPDDATKYQASKKTITLEVVAKAATTKAEVTIMANKNLVVKAGDSYSANDITGKKALSGGKEISGIWQLSDTSIDAVGVYKINLIFTPADNKYQSATLEISLKVTAAVNQPNVNQTNVNQNSTTPNKPINFSDVKAGDWFKPGVDFVSSRGIMNGTAADVFSPQGKITKAMLVTMLQRLSGDGNVMAAEAFSDVQAGQWFTEAAKWSVVKGITTAANGRFEPNHPLSREEFVTMIYNYAKYKHYDTSKLADLSQFTDLNKVSSAALVPLKWAVEAGIINGVSETSLSPQTGATRAQMATIFMRFIQKYIEN